MPNVKIQRYYYYPQIITITRIYGSHIFSNRNNNFNIYVNRKNQDYNIISYLCVIFLHGSKRTNQNKTFLSMPRPQGI